jgi:adsorption protein B
MWLDHWVALLLAPVAIWVLLNAVDDLVIDAAVAVSCLRSPPVIPTDEELAAIPERRMAIFVPLWNEHRVIRHMVEYNLASIRYQNYEFFVGAYPNDPLTIESIEEAQRLSPRVHLAVCPHNGPTCKADCLNWIYQRMLLYEEANQVRFEMILTHDAEDLIYSDALTYINYYAQSYEMVQIPVLALPTGWREFTHGVYCDEFAEFQYRDLPARQYLGGFIPSNGVGTGFSRTALEAMAAAHSNRIFEPASLTEDYENGFRLHQIGLAQIFIPVHRRNGAFVATREYFPRNARAAIRQRSRWVTGIALQGWEHHGWTESLPQLYWFWRDRKCLVGSLVTPLANTLFLYGGATWVWAALHHASWTLPLAVRHHWLAPVCGVTLSIQAFHLTLRCYFCSRIYGWAFGIQAPLRVFWGNWINFRACGLAIRRYGLAKWRKQPLVWLKTEHSYPIKWL